MEDKEKKDGVSEVHLLGGVGVLVLYKIYEWVAAWFTRWIVSPYHKVGLVLALLLVLGIWLTLAWRKLLALKAKNERENAVLADAPGAVYCGESEDKKPVYVKTRQRSMHTQVVGTTNAGKTESVILPWAIQDIEQGRGLLLIDGKADGSLLSKLWAYTCKAEREKDFRLFSLGHLEESCQFNPLIGGTAEEITERVFNAFDFENPYYKALQYEVMGQTMRIFEANGTVPTFQRLHQTISAPQLLQGLADKTKDEGLMFWADHFCGLSNSDREQRTSGLLSALGHFAFGKTASLFNAEKNPVTIEEALSKKQIVYFQLPVLLSPFLGKATGKLVLQCLQAAVANRHRGANRTPDFFSVFLDDFSEYLYPGFVSILNKSRSANVGVVFAHQALGDIAALGDPIANAILTNSNVKVFMRGNDPDSAEYFSKVIGTKGTVKYTERQKLGFLSTEKSGDVSAREVEEFVIHPNAFKRELGVGQAVMLLPHDGGTKTIRIKFRRYEDLDATALPKTTKDQPGLLASSKVGSSPERPNATFIDDTTVKNFSEVA
jgi:type IV secretory pathway TraG/TraD family ATPase VirD4